MGDEVGFAGEGWEWVGEVLPEEDALDAGPLEAEGGVVFEDRWGVGEEGSVPEVGAASVEDVDGLAAGVGAVEVEAEGAG